MQELWRPVIGWEGFYEVSDLGRVKSLARTTCKGVEIRERILRQVVGSNGYLKVGLRANGKGATKSVHGLVAAAFIGPRPSGLVVLHDTGGSLDNRLANLSYGTQAKNMGPDRLRDDTHIRGERNYQAKLTAEQVLEARRLVAANPKQTRAILARQWGVTYSTLNNAVNGRTWTWL